MTIGAILLAEGSTGMGLAAMQLPRAQGDDVRLADSNAAAVELACLEASRGGAGGFVGGLLEPDSPPRAVALDRFGGIDARRVVRAEWRSYRRLMVPYPESRCGC